MFFVKFLMTVTVALMSGLSHWTVNPKTGRVPIGLDFPDSLPVIAAYSAKALSAQRVFLCRLGFCRCLRPVGKEENSFILASTTPVSMGVAK